MEERVAQDDAAAQAIEDRIYEINKPVAATTNWYSWRRQRPSR